MSMVMAPLGRDEGEAMKEQEQASNAEVLWIVPKAWEEDLTIIVMRPVALHEWRQIIAGGGMVVTLEPEGRIQGGPADGGHVVRVDGEDGLHYFAVPRQAFSALRGLVPDADYARLLAEGEAGDESDEYGANAC